MNGFVDWDCPLSGNFVNCGKNAGFAFAFAVGGRKALAVPVTTWTAFSNCAAVLQLFCEWYFQREDKL